MILSLLGEISYTEIPRVVRKGSPRFMHSEMKTEIGPLYWAESNLPADAFTLNKNTDTSLGRSNRLWDKMGLWIWLPLQLQAALVFFQVSGMLQKADSKELLTEEGPLTLWLSSQTPPYGGGADFDPSGVNLEQWILVNFSGIPLEKSMYNENETFLKQYIFILLHCPILQLKFFWGILMLVWYGRARRYLINHCSHS